MNITLSKRQKYLLHSILTVIPLYFFSKKLPEINVTLLVVLVLVVYIGSFLVHRPNSTIKNILITSILPVFLLTGYILSVIYYPNLSDIFRLGSMLGFMGLFYATLLVNNVFLVVESRKEPIPLYRVAATWSKILLAATAVPLLAGVYKISVNSFMEVVITFVITALFVLYLIWFSEHNPDTKTYKIGEIITISILTCFIVPVANLSVSFIPTETFLRALYVSSVLLFCISYIEAHLKNSITRKLISEHFGLSFIFLLLLFIFKP